MLNGTAGICVQSPSSVQRVNSGSEVKEVESFMQQVLTSIVDFTVCQIPTSAPLRENLPISRLLLRSCTAADSSENRKGTGCSLEKSATRENH